MSLAASARDVNQRLSAGASWFLHSGIQEPSGGVARYHRADTGRNAPVSTEITGYFISALADLDQRAEGDGLMEAARRAARFLHETAWDSSCAAMPFEWSANGGPEPRHTYFFDNGIVVRALVRLWRRTAEPWLLETARQCAESMRRDFVNERDIHPILELPSKRPAARDARWSRQSDCYQLKAALAWLDVEEATGEARWRGLFDRALERALRTHAAFPGLEPGEREMDRLHAYAYFLEALLARADQAEARRALEWGLRRCGDGLRRLRAGFERSDVCAQLVRVRLWAGALGAVRLDESRAAEEAAWAAAYQMTGGPNVEGAFCFGQRGGRPAPFANPASTAFCLQALALWADHCAGLPLPEWKSLI
jgi:hypothetical protein